MAIYHLSAKPISRAQGRSATGAAAYRAGVEITDERTGLVHDYSRKGGVLHAELVLPGGGSADRAEFWNRLEAHHKRGDAVLVREVEISLPTELSTEQRQALAVGYARELADRYGVAADLALHAPRTVSDRELEKNPGQHWEIDPDTGRRHNGNWHAHVMLSACHVAPDGTLGKKAVELDPIHCQRAKPKLENLVDRERARWAELVNAALERHGHEARVDHRSHAERGIETAPTLHLGPGATGYERRTGELSETRMRQEANADRLALGREVGELERQAQATDRAILDLSGGLEAAQRERDRQPQPEAKQTAVKPLEALPMADQVKAWEAALKKAQVSREQRLARVSQKAHDRYQRRYKAAEQLRRDQPEAPSGLLAAFKQRTYKEAVAAWSQSFARAGKLEEQAAALCSRVGQAWGKAKSWAYDKLSQAHPALAKRVQDHQQAELRKKIEQQQREREAKRAQQKGRYRGR